MRIATLEHTSPEAQLHAFLAAFADYPLPPQLTQAEFDQMLRRTGCRAELSVGAFEGDELIGFIHNGIRPWQGVLAAYDQGTAVVPAWRRQGITSALFDGLLPILKTAGVGRYVLEVLQKNKPAYELYLKKGFQVTREFDCLAREKAGLPAANAGWVLTTVEDVTALDWDACAALWDDSPSWQNSPDSVRAIAGCFKAVTATMDGQLAGYGIIDRRTGSIPQLAVAPGCRRAGLGQALLAALASRTESDRLSVINVTAGSSGAAFLRSLEFNLTVGQYEMVREL